MRGDTHGVITWTVALPPNGGVAAVLVEQLEDAGLVARCEECMAETLGIVWHNRQEVAAETIAEALGVPS